MPMSNSRCSGSKIINNWGKPEQAPLLRGKWYGGPCTKNCGKNGIATPEHITVVVHVQTNTINFGYFHASAKISIFMS